MKTFTETFDHNGDELVATLEVSLGLTQAWVTGPDGFSATLEALIDNGVLTNRAFDEHGIFQDVIDEIQDWAEEHGY